MTAHRYWRIKIDSTTNGSYIGAAEIQFRGSVGGASLFGGGTPSASDASIGAAALAVDGNTSTYWMGSYTGYGWFKYDFGAGNDVDVAEVYILPRQDAATISPNIFHLQYSDDDSSWTTTVTYCHREVAWSTAGKAFAPAYFPSPVSGGHQYWKIHVTDTPQGSYVGFAEVELRATAGGANQCGATAPGIVTASSDLDLSRGWVKSVDGSTGTYWQSGTGSFPEWWTYNFGNAQVVTEVAITPRVDVYSVGPSEFVVYSSDDGTNWTEEGTFTEVTWPNANQQTFAVGGPPPYDDGTSSGGPVFGGEVVEITTLNDGISSGGIVFGGAEISDIENHQVEGASSGGIVFGGTSGEQWRAEPNNWVAVKGGTYRIAGTLYTLPETLSYQGLGSIAALVNCGVAPTSAGLYRYDLLSIGAAGTITVTAGTEAATPVMPATPTSEVKLDHVLRYYGQTSIVQADIGKLYMAPQLTTLTAAVTDDELAWAETSTTITITCRDQYGQLYTGSKVINAAITTGNGTIAPASQSGSGSSFTFTYTRGGNDPGDVSPVITFSSPTGPFCTAFIKLLDASGDLMT